MHKKTMVELRQDLTAITRAVERGEAVLVTDRNRPVALMVPVSQTHWPTLDDVNAAIESLPREEL